MWLKLEAAVNRAAILRYWPARVIARPIHSKRVARIESPLPPNMRYSIVNSVKEMSVAAT
jgi:hypothetical protein